MSEQLFSPHWYRVAGLRLSLRAHVRMYPHEYRGIRWYVLRDDATGRHHRFNEPASHFIRLLDGQRTVEEIWKMNQELHADDAPTQDEVIRLLGRLYFADQLLGDLAPDVEELINRRAKERRRLLIARLGNPLAIRIPLLDPDRFLTRWSRLATPFFSRTALLLMLLLAGAALLQAFRHWEPLSRHAMEHALSPYNLFLLWLVYPLVKALHELGHGFAVKRWGGEVHEFGIMLLVLMPVPYVDASAASSYRSKYRRMVVGAAGIIVELVLASAALLLWLNVQQGVLADVLFNVMLIGGVSTLLFNGNPLLRFDGYYVLCDAVEIPGLGTRANRYYGYLVQRWLFRSNAAISPVTAAGEKAWFVVYGAAAFCYRLTIIVMIVLYVSGKYFFIGTALAIWAVLTQLAMPVIRWIRYLLLSPSLARRRERALLVTLGTIAAAASAVILVPVPLNTQAEGVVWMPEHSYVRAGGSGFIEEVLATEGEYVRRGQALVITSDPLMADRLELLEARKAELQIQYHALKRDDIVESDITMEEIRVLEGKIARLKEQLDDLTIRSPADGTFVVPASADLRGQYLKQGDTIAYVIDTGAVSVRTVVPQNSIGLVRKRTHNVEIRLAGDVQTAIASAIEREVPGATYRLPSKALAREGGGRIRTDPFDEENVKTRKQYFQFDIALPERVESVPIGQRVHVRFSHGYEPLAAQWYRIFEELLLDELGRI